MKNRILTIIAVALCAATLLAACNQQPGDTAEAQSAADTTVSVAVVDMAKAYQESAPAKAARAYLEEQGKALQDDVRAAQEAMEAEQSEENNKAFQEAMTNYQMSMGAEQQRVVGLFNEQFTEILEQYRADKGIQVILPKEAVAAVAPSVDITDEIVAAPDEADIDFTAVAEGQGQDLPEEGGAEDEAGQE